MKRNIKSNSPFRSEKSVLEEGQQVWYFRRESRFPAEETFTRRYALE